MQEALAKPLAPQILRFALPAQPETAIGLTHDGEGYFLVRLEFDTSLWYESWIDVDDIPDDSADIDGISRVVFREDGGPLGYSIQDFDRVEVRVASLSIPITDALATALVSVLDSLTAANDREQSELIMIDGVSLELTQSNGQCLRTRSSVEPDSAARQLVALARFFEREMDSWTGLTKAIFEADAAEYLDGFDPVD